MNPLGTLCRTLGTIINTLNPIPLHVSCYAQFELNATGSGVDIARKSDLTNYTPECNEVDPVAGTETCAGPPGVTCW